MLIITIFIVLLIITVMFQVYLNLPAGLYQVKFEFQYYADAGIKGVLYDITFENELCQNLRMYT